MAGERQLVPQRRDGLAPPEGRGLGPSSRPPPGREKLLSPPPPRSPCLRARALPGTRPWGWTKDAPGTPGRGGAPGGRSRQRPSGEMGEGVAGDPPDRGVGQGLSRGPGGGRPPPLATPRWGEGRISASPEVLVAGCHFLQQVGDVVRSARHVAGLDPACWLSGCWAPRPGLLLSLAAAPASRVAAQRGPGKALRRDVQSPARRGWGGEWLRGVGGRGG